MDRQQILAELTAERIELCDYLETLEPHEWPAVSLCPGWTVHDVVAHLALNTEETTLGFVLGLIRARGNFDRMSFEQARMASTESSPDALITRLRLGAGSAQRAPGSSHLDPFLDVLVHGQDISLAINRRRPIPRHRAVPALDHAVTSRFYGARKRFLGVRLIATDTEWTHGDGPAEVCGPVADLLLVATGRPAGLTKLTGNGLATVAERLATIKSSRPPT